MRESFQETIGEAIPLRNSGRADEARTRPIALHDPVMNLQVAWTHDKPGMESDRIKAYKPALAEYAADLDRSW